MGTLSGEATIPFSFLPPPEEMDVIFYRKYRKVLA